MSSSGGPSQALGAVYQALDEERYEEAAQLCRRAGAQPMARALLAFSLIQTDQATEAKAISRELLDGQPEEVYIENIVVLPVFHF
jgi:hypothetical protein